MDDSAGIVWMTGLPGAGKSTLARHVVGALKKEGLRSEVLDGDEARRTFSKGLGFSREDRFENIARIAFVAGLLARNGVWAVVAAVSPYLEMRRDARQLARREGVDFIEVYVRCPVEVSEARDTKGLYRMARAGEIAHFTGVSDPYEAPLEPEIVVDTDRESPAPLARRIVEHVTKGRGR